MSQKILSHPLYPRLPQALSIYVFIVIFGSLIFGPKDADSNFGLVTTWILWWPLVPLSLFFMGRAWCAFCPWGALTDWIQSHFNLKMPVPKWIKKHGIWVILGGFMFLSWYELAYGFTSSKFATAGVLVFITVFSLAISVFFEKRIWCHYLCPLGGFLGNYAQTSFIELRGTTEKCSDCKQVYCFQGGKKAPGCAVSEFPKNMDSNRLCNLCGDCVKNCEKNSPKVSLRFPGKELWQNKKRKLDEAVLSALLVGVILVSGFGMLEFWDGFIDGIKLSTGLNSVLLTTISFFSFGIIALLIALVASYFSSRSSKEPILANFTRYGYALIPLNLGAHISHNLFHLLGEGKNIYTTFSELFFKIQVAQASENGMQASAEMASPALASQAAIQIIQVSIMTLGLIASIYVAWMITKKFIDGNDEITKKRVRAWGSFLPHLFLIIIFGLVSYLMFIMPMTMRG